MNHDQSNPDYCLSVRNLGCSRYESILFSGLNFSLGSGQLLQVEGENGSGKTTLLKTLCGFIEPDEGDVLWQGQNIRLARETYQGQLNYLGHNNGIKTGLTCIENLRISTAYASRLNTTDFQAVLERYGLGGFEDSFAFSLSAGQKRRLALTRLAIHEARLWILDEPFTSLDERGRNSMKGIFQDHLQSGGMILMTSHDVIQWQGVNPLKVSL